MCSTDWPDWERVMYYIALIYRHFEGSTSNSTTLPLLPVSQATSLPVCNSLRSSNSMTTTFCSPLQTV